MRGLRMGGGRPRNLVPVLRWHPGGGGHHRCLVCATLREEEEVSRCPGPPNGRRDGPEFVFSDVLSGGPGNAPDRRAGNPEVGQFTVRQAAQLRDSRAINPCADHSVHDVGAELCDALAKGGAMCACFSCVCHVLVTLFFGLLGPVGCQRSGTCSVAPCHSSHRLRPVKMKIGKCCDCTIVSLCNAAMQHTQVVSDVFLGT